MLSGQECVVHAICAKHHLCANQGSGALTAFGQGTSHLKFSPAQFGWEDTADARRSAVKKAAKLEVNAVCRTQQRPQRP